mmetsp:Transcript_12581/g.18523  ORF Transcript_12581/g.18523 Transcript_12581/m.18523 type:complete len:519 (-) Transcript_12581:551-2107(-)|eukprot:CAMPEP_0194028176 /NCGR_PEP_ID=MMETSP0009_2-20130614/2209_1 /TAXON_ID=210454 /ORGANISM="Grammatophora oceanica, Strain CCMP 410" /LENGTH=518 /DNA_ID=CAMNT_0038667489 /DNA_START=134 /DNA_END=1690 /DNA_ORIENTATION=+
MTDKEEKSDRARSVLGWAALFLGELRDGLTMINMQSAFLMVSKNYSEKQAGVMFFVFGMSQFLFQTPAGYLMDYTDRKILCLSVAGIGTTILTLVTAAFATENGGNLGLMVFIKFLQGAITSLIPPGLNSITQGIVGQVNMTSQVSINEMMNHLGTAIIVLSGSLIAFWRFPDIGILFIVSPIFCLGLIVFLCQIRPDDIDHAAARGLKAESSTDKPAGSSGSAAPAKPYNPPAALSPTGKKEDPIQTQPSFTFGWGTSQDGKNYGTPGVKADTPLQVLRDPVLLVFIVIVFLFHTANGTVLPLVMQSLAIGNGRSGILMSGLCIIVAQVFMVLSAKICGSYSGVYGRKGFFLFGFFSVPIRCLILWFLIGLRDAQEEVATWLQILILSTQILDGIGAGTFGTMYILVTSDIAGGTGRFSLILGMTTAAMSIGGTVSGYLGQALAEDLSYRTAFFILAVMSLVPAVLYLLFMPETLPALSKKEGINTMTSIREQDEEEPNVSKPSVTTTDYVNMPAVS